MKRITKTKPEKACGDSSLRANY